MARKKRKKSGGSGKIIRQLPMPTEEKLLESARRFGLGFRKQRLNRVLSVRETAACLGVEPGVVRAWEEEQSWPKDDAVLRKLGTISPGFKSLVKRFKTCLFVYPLGSPARELPPPWERGWPKGDDDAGPYVGAVFIEYGHTHKKVASLINVAGRGTVTHAAVRWWTIPISEGGNTPVVENYNQLTVHYPEIALEHVPTWSNIRPIKSPDGPWKKTWTQVREGEPPMKTPIPERAQLAAPEPPEPAPPLPTVKGEPRKPARRKPSTAKPAARSVVNGKAHAPIVLKDAGGTRIELPHGFNPDDLRTVLDVLRERSPDES